MSKGFTLVELLTVVLIIGILTSVALPQYMRAIERSRATEAMSTIKAINDAVYAYAAGRVGANACPTSFKKLVVSVPGTLVTDAKLNSGNFIYELNKATNASIPGTSCAGVVATRNANGKFDYKIWNPYTTGTAGTSAALACTGSAGKGKEICESLQIYTSSSPY